MLESDPRHSALHSTFRIQHSAFPAVVLFDGVCNLCNRFVRFVVRRDPAGYFQFASLGSDAAVRMLGGGPVPDPLPDSVVLVENGQVFTRSTAALRIARRLTFPWPLAYGLILVPAPIRDLIYDTIARRRYRWFGRRESCMLPGPGLRDRFL
jgi:predicted DCC family thiol-disulfide oxidoreductase YuxK